MSQTSLEDVKWDGQINKSPEDRPDKGSFELQEIDWKVFRDRSKTTELPILVNLAEVSKYIEVDPKRLGFLHTVKNSIIKSRVITTGSGKKRRLFFPNMYSDDEKINGAASLLKVVHKMLLYKLFQNLPRSEAVWGFVDGRDVVSCAQQHVDKDIVVAVDMTDFFPNTTYTKIRKALKEYTPWSDKVIWMLTELCTYKGHAPQGFATSPMISNFVFKPVDDTLLAWAENKGWTYTRYADDLIFSASGNVLDLMDLVDTELLPLIEGESAKLQYRVNKRKTKIMVKPNRQHVLGLTVNKKLNIPRWEFYNLKAEVFNFAFRGLIPLEVYKDYNSGNKEAVRAYFRTLRGRVAWGYRINPERFRVVHRMISEVDPQTYKFKDVWEFNRRTNRLDRETCKPVVPEGITA